MKKRLLLLLVCALLTACTSTKPEKAGEPSENYCNDETNAGTCGLGGMDMSDYDGFQDRDNVFVKSDMAEAIQLFQNKKDAILYFGFPDCPWCIEALPIMDESAKAHKKTIYYIQTRDKNKKLLYSEAQKKALFPYVDAFLKTDKKGEKKLYVPFVVVVKKGKAIKANIGTVEGHDAHERKMNEKEKRQLRKIYDAMFE